MLKACKLLAVAAMTAMVLAGCAKTTDVDASLETGTANYDFAGKTLVSVDTRSYTKQIETSVFDSATGITATNTTETAIPYWRIPLRSRLPQTKPIPALTSSRIFRASTAITAQPNRSRPQVPLRRRRRRGILIQAGLRWINGPWDLAEPCLLRMSIPDPGLRFSSKTRRQTAAPSITRLCTRQIRSSTTK